jgi:hypothetical protein
LSLGLDHGFVLVWPAGKDRAVHGDVGGDGLCTAGVFCVAGGIECAEGLRGAV